MWGNAPSPERAARGPLLLKLDANGNSEWQKAYNAGVHCFTGIGTQCSAIGGIACSVQQTSDGGYSVAGAGPLEFPSGAPLVPWLAKTDPSGNLVWQYSYYQSYPTTGSPISQYFASSTLTSDGGYLSLGFTENRVDGKGELFAVRTHSAGLVGTCSSATARNVVDPGLATIAPIFPVQRTAPAQADLPATTRSTSIGSTGGGC